jgi:chromosome segregation ATPase
MHAVIERMQKMKSCAIAVLFAVILSLFLPGCASGAEEKNWREMYEKSKTDYDALVKSSGEEIAALKKSAAARDAESASQHARNWREAFTMLQRDYEELSQYNQAQIKALREVIDNREKIIEQRNGVITKLQDSIKAISDDLATAVTNYATVKRDLVTLLNDHTKVLLLITDKDKAIKKLTTERDYLKAKCAALEAEIKKLK